MIYEQCWPLLFQNDLLRAHWNESLCIPDKAYHKSHIPQGLQDSQAKNGGPPFSTRMFRTITPPSSQGFPNVKLWRHLGRRWFVCEVETMGAPGRSPERPAESVNVIPWANSHHIERNSVERRSISSNDFWPTLDHASKHFMKSPFWSNSFELVKCKCSFASRL